MARACFCAQDTTALPTQFSQGISLLRKDSRCRKGCSCASRHSVEKNSKNRMNSSRRNSTVPKLSTRRHAAAADRPSSILTNRTAGLRRERHAVPVGLCRWTTTACDAVGPQVTESPAPGRGRGNTATILSQVSSSQDPYLGARSRSPYNSRPHLIQIPKSPLILHRLRNADTLQACCSENGLATRVSRRGCSFLLVELRVNTQEHATQHCHDVSWRRERSL